MKKAFTLLSVVLVAMTAPAYAALLQGSFSGKVFTTIQHNPELPSPPTIGSDLRGEFMYKTEDAVGSGGTYRTFSQPSYFYIKAGGWTFDMDLSANEPGTSTPAGMEVHVRNDEDLGGSDNYDIFEVQGFGTPATFPFTVDHVNEVFFAIGDPTGALIQDTSLPTSLNLSGMPFHNFVAMVDLIDSEHNEWSFLAKLDSFTFGPTPTVTTTQSYTTDLLTLGDTFNFDAWWEMGEEPENKNFDLLFFHDGEWKFLGWDINFDGSSTEWETLSFIVPEWARGIETQIKFVLADLGEYTDPTVYLRNIGSNPVPEPSTIILLGTGLIGLAGWGRKFRKR